MPGSIPLTGAQGLFTRIGTLGTLLNSINQSRGTSVPDDVTLINDQFISTDQDVIDSLYSSLLSYQNSCSSFNSQIRSMASNTIIEMVNDVQPQNNLTISTALKFLINQMVAQSQTVNQCTISSSFTPDSDNIGNPNIIISLRDMNNLLVEDCFAENATATVTQDSQSNPSLAGIERINLASQYSVQDTFSWMYPAGSGTNIGLSAVSGMTNGGSGASNWLNNGSFETWSPTGGSTAFPTSWHIETGTPGSTILQSTTHYDGTYSLEFLGNGSENTAVYQQFSTPAARFDTTANISTNSIYMFNLWCQVTGTPSGGTIRIALSNGTTPINDNSGNPNSFDIDLTTLTNTWVPFGGTFRTPNQNPAALWLEIKMITPITSGFGVFFDRVSFCVPSRWYPGGPYIGIFSGNINLIQGDSFLINISNLYNGTQQYFFDKCFNMKSLGLILPSSVTPSIPDF